MDQKIDSYIPALVPALHHEMPKKSRKADQDEFDQSSHEIQVNNLNATDTANEFRIKMAKIIEWIHAQKE